MNKYFQKDLEEGTLLELLLNPLMSLLKGQILSFQEETIYFYISCLKWKFQRLRMELLKSKGLQENLEKEVKLLFILSIKELMLLELVLE